MENNLTDFQKKIQQNLNPVNIFLAILEVVFVIFVVVALREVLVEPQEPAEIEVADIFGEIDGLPSESAGVIRSSLYDVVSLNSEDYSSVDDSGAVVREGSVANEYFEGMNMHYVNFIVDIPSLQQSYQVFHEWTDDYDNPYFLIDNSVIVMCLTKDKMIYDDFECVDNINERGRYYVVDQFAPVADFGEYNGVVSYNVVAGDLGGDMLGSSGDVTRAGSYVEIVVDWCENDKKIEGAIAAVDKWFGVLGYGLEDFEYDVVRMCERYDEDV